MRKRIVTSTPTTVQAQRAWLDLERAATVEVTSEDKEFPIESSLSIEPGQGWRAAQPGTQTIRLVFDEPQELKTISLVFEENEVMRTQEFVLRPELANLPNRWIHQPWNMPAPERRRIGLHLGQTCPKPIVNHATARQEALNAFHSLKVARCTSTKLPVRLTGEG